MEKEKIQMEKEKIQMDFIKYLFIKQNESHEFILEELTRNGHEMTKEKLEEIIASLKKQIEERKIINVIKGFSFHKLNF